MPKIVPNPCLRRRGGQLRAEWNSPFTNTNVESYATTRPLYHSLGNSLCRRSPRTKSSRLNS